MDFFFYVESLIDMVVQSRIGTVGMAAGPGPREQLLGFNLVDLRS